MTTHSEYHDHLAEKLNNLESKVATQAKEIVSQAHKIDLQAVKIDTQAKQIDVLAKKVDMQAKEIDHLRNTSERYAHVATELEDMKLKYRGLVTYNSRQQTFAEKIELELPVTTDIHHTLVAQHKSLYPDKGGVAQRLEQPYHKDQVGSLQELDETTLECDADDQALLDDAKNADDILYFPQDADFVFGGQDQYNLNSAFNFDLPWHPANSTHRT